MLTPIKQARLEREVPQWDLSNRTGIRASRLSQIENGRVEARPDEIERIAAALRVSLTSLGVNG